MKMEYLVFDCREGVKELVAECENWELVEEFIEDYISYEKCEKKDIKVEKMY
jgi:hypothetical protein